MRQIRRIARMVPKTSSSCHPPKHLQMSIPRLESWCRGMQRIPRLLGIVSSWVKVRYFSSYPPKRCRVALSIFRVMDPFFSSLPTWTQASPRLPSDICASVKLIIGFYGYRVGCCGVQGKPHGPSLCPSSGEPATNETPTDPGGQGFRVSNTAS